jgi:hypothetical protein
MAVGNLTIAALLGRPLDRGGLLSHEQSLRVAVCPGLGHHRHAPGGRAHESQPLVGAVTAPIAMAITAFAALSLPDTMQGSEPLVPALKSNWLMMHVSVMLISYAALLVGSLLAIAFLIVTRGQAVELKGSSVGTGGFRNLKVQRASQPQAAPSQPHAQAN